MHEQVGVDRQLRELRRVTVDLTPLLPGGDNGGAKALARTLVQQLAQAAPEIDFTVLTSSAGYADVADLDAANVHRQCIETVPMFEDQGSRPARSVRRVIRVAIDAVLPQSVGTNLKDYVWRRLKRYHRARTMRSLQPDLVFSPFTAPYFAQPGVPHVSVAHDLQYLHHPEFFTEEQRRDRHENFLGACQYADRLICVSEFVRGTVLATGEIAPERVQTIHSTLLRAPERDPTAGELARDLLRSRGVQPSRYLLYPANAWPHKNHRRLLEAFALFLERRPGSHLALVCTGAPQRAADEVMALADTLLPPGTFAYMGYLSEREFAALLQSSRGIIFPSLYEGFGLPVLEGMAYERPVLCSNVASLPEIAGEAALLFDPRDPSAIADAIARLESDNGLEACLVRRGRERVARFGSARDMAVRYLAAFKEVVASFTPRRASAPSSS